MKNGFTLIEVIISTALISIILSLVIVLFFHFRVDFNHEILQNKNNYYMNEALMFIESQLNREMTNLEVIGNTIHLDLEDGKKKIIEKRNSNLIIRYGTKYGMTNRNNKIITDIKDFQVTENNNLLYVKIIMEEGWEKERCFVLNR